RDDLCTGVQTCALPISLGDIRSAICTGLTWSAAASAHQMLPPAASAIGSPPVFGVTRALPQVQSIAPAYAPPASPAMPIPPLISAPAAMPIPALAGAGPRPISVSPA